MKHDNPKKLIPQLANNSKFFHRAFANPCINVKPKAPSEQCAPYCTIGSLVPTVHVVANYNYRMRWRCNFKGISLFGGRADFSKNLLVSLFNDNLSNEPNFGRWTVPLK
jgi:hypothetical protein